MCRYIHSMEHESDKAHHRATTARTQLVDALRTAVTLAAGSLDTVDTPASRREAVRGARRALKSVRALAPLCRNGHREGGVDQAIASVLEFSAKANQMLGPLRDRDALLRSIHRLVDRFADAQTRTVARTVLVATLIHSEGERRDDAAYAGVSIERAHRALRAARGAVAHLGIEGAFDPAHATTLVLRAFRDCRTELSAALEASDLVRLHDCRKMATFLALALRPFEDDVPAAVARMRSRAKRLAAALGEDRDLALLDVEMSAARAQLAGSPLATAIDDAVRLARIEALARVEDAAASFLRVRRGGVRRGVRELLGA